MLAGERTRWIVAGAGAVLILALVLVFFRGVQPNAVPDSRPKLTPSPPTIQPTAQVELAKSTSADPVLAEELALRDMRPLFLPTERLSVALPEPRREPGKTFLDDETFKLSFSEADLNVERGLPPPATLAGKPVQAATSLDFLARDSTPPTLEGFGREGVAVSPLPAHGGYIEAVAMATGHTVWSEALPADARAPGNKPWQPLEIVASIDAAGLTAPLVIASSSESEEVDVHYRNYLAQRYRIGDRLPPGFYRIIVGP